MTDTVQFRALARFNQWANARLDVSIGQLDPLDYTRDFGGQYGSLHALLNHALSMDRVWLHRLSGVSEPLDRLDGILFENRETLLEARKDQDGRLIRHIDTYTDSDLSGRFQYRNLAGKAFDDSLALILTHVFTVQAQLRGRALQILDQAGLEQPQIDLIFYMHRQKG